MQLDRYRLLAQVGAGSDGISYRAVDSHDGSPVEVRMLRGARADAGRWHDVKKRLRLAVLLDHVGALKVQEVALEHDPPYVVLESVGGTALAALLCDRLPLQEPGALELAQQIASVLLPAHRLGLFHGRLSPTQVQVLASGRIQLDFTGLDTFTPSPDAAGAELERACSPPEYLPGGAGRAAHDVYGLGALTYWMLVGKAFSGDAEPGQSFDSLRRTVGSAATSTAGTANTLDRLVRAMLAANPVDRPPISEVAGALAALYCVPAATGEFVLAADVPGLGATIAHEPTSAHLVHPEDGSPRERLGRFHLLNKLGQGGMGAVYRAEDLTDGTQVAIKVLRADFAARPNAIQRFHKEARLLAEVNNPFVANLLEVNEDDGIHYLALEFVQGRSLGALLEERVRLSEGTAVRTMADVARALVDAHERGIVHRDIKPDNILLVLPPGKDQKTGEPESLRIKLTDFGLARHVVETDSLNVTQTGAILGTPLYMAPEQCSGTGTVGPATDVYAMGATLYHLLAGRPPFVGPSQVSIIHMHCHEAPPPLKKLNPAISDGVAEIVHKCLAKSADARYANAGALLRDLERVIRGEPTSIVVHPKLPDCDPARVLHYDWTWALEASPARLWPYVSDTDRLNRAVGLPAVQFSTRDEAGRGVRRLGKFKKAGVTAVWQEHPFEWIEARRMGVLREYQQGPFKWMVSTVELEPRTGGGTLLTHHVRIEPSGLLGRTVAAVEVGVKGRRAVDRVYRRIDAAVTGKVGRPDLADPFEEPFAPTAAARRRLDQVLERLGKCGVDLGVVERLGDFLALAPPQEVARIRPLALAQRLKLDADEVVAACLHGAREGLLVLLWDILCPVCRIPSEVKETLKALREHGRCEACNLDFELDFGNSVEMIFRAHPQIRDTDLGTYCIGGPAHSPHVVAQVRVSPSERIELDLELPEGAYRLRGPQLPFSWDFRTLPTAAPTRLELNLSKGPEPELPRVFKSGHQLLALTNDHPQELVARIERTAARADALTAARASASALFRELFPGEVLSPGQLVSVANVVLLVTDLEHAGALYQKLGDARAFGLIHEHFRLLNDGIRGEGGAVVKTVGEGMIAVFNDSVAAVRAALAARAILAGQPTTRGLRLRAGVHRGPAMAATLNEHLDYFGTTVQLAGRLLQFAAGGELVLTPAVAGDAQVLSLLRSRGLESVPVNADLAGETSVLHRIALPAAESTTPSSGS
jgi:serine/threonine protein kinase/class 3 adenylate cyclase